MRSEDTGSSVRSRGEELKQGSVDRVQGRWPQPRRTILRPLVGSAREIDTQRILIEHVPFTLGTKHIRSEAVDHLWTQ